MRSLRYLLLLLVTVGLAQPAMAQVLPEVAIVGLSPTSASLRSNLTQDVSYQVDNDGLAAATCTVTYALQGAAGWTPSKTGEPTFAVANDDPVPFTVSVGPVHTNATTPTNGTLVITANCTDQTGNNPTSDDARVTLAYIAPDVPPPPPPPPPSENYVPQIVVGILFGLALVAFAVYLFLATQVRLTAAEPVKRVNPGIDAVYEIRAANLAGSPRNVELRVQQRPVGWGAALSFPSVRLQGRESTTVPLYVKVPFDTPHGSVGRLRIQARPASYFPWLRSLEVAARAADVGQPPLPPPSDPRAKPRRWTGDVHDVLDVEGIGPAYAEKLHAIGITNTRELLDADPADVAVQTAIQEPFVRTWQAMADLIRIKGIYKQFAELLVRAGIRGVDALAHETPASVVHKVGTYLDRVEQAPTKGSISEDMAKRWISAAKKLGGYLPEAHSTGARRPASGTAA